MFFANHLIFSCLLFTWISTTFAVKDESKWIWSKNNKQTDAVISAASPRLALENDRAPEGRPLFLPANEPSPYRPGVSLSPPPPRGPSYRPPVPVLEPSFGSEPYRPPIYRPTTQGFGGGSRYPERPPPPTISPLRPPSKGVLTGPVPSWEQDRENPNRYNAFDTCKCVYGLNCKSPGIKFGHCDVDKQYCCFNEKNEARYEGHQPGRPSRGPYDGAILVGPGGPTGVIARPRPHPLDSYARSKQ